jgi:hypothetical protein
LSDNPARAEGVSARKAFMSLANPRNVILFGWVMSVWMRIVVTMI